MSDYGSTYQLAAWARRHGCTLDLAKAAVREVDDLRRGLSNQSARLSEARARGHAAVAEGRHEDVLSAVLEERDALEQQLIAARAECDRLSERVLWSDGRTAAVLAAREPPAKYVPVEMDGTKPHAWRETIGDLVTPWPGADRWKTEVTE